MQRWLLGAALCLCLTGPGHAQAVETGSELLEACQLALGHPETPPDSAKAGFCIGFVNGVIVFGLSHPGSFCPSSGVNLDQAIRVLVKHLNAEPELNDMAAEIGAIAAFKQEWPCDDPKPEGARNRGHQGPVFCNG